MRLFLENAPKKMFILHFNSRSLVLFGCENLNSITVHGLLRQPCNYNPKFSKPRRIIRRQQEDSEGVKYTCQK